jgi:hypothetical protein
MPDQLCQNAAGCVRMDECDLVTEDAAPRLLVHELGAGGRKASELGADIVHLECDVMQTGTALGEELADGGVRAARGEQLDSALTEAKEHDLGPLFLQGLPELYLGAEQPPVRVDRLLEVVDRDTDVVDAADRHAGDATGVAVPSELALVQRPHDADCLGRT